VVAHAYNPSYSGGGNREVQGQLGQKVSELPISTNKLGVVAHACDPTYEAGRGSSTQFKVGPRHKAGDPTLKVTKVKRLVSGSSGRVPA
jgi:hypothetical protein